MIVRSKWVQDNKLYFYGLYIENNVTHRGIWVTDSQGRCTIDQLVNGATTVQSIYRTNNVWWTIANNANDVIRTDTVGSASYGDATYISQMFSGGDSRETKQLMSITTATDGTERPLVQYRADGTKTWTDIYDLLTPAQDSARRHTAVNIEDGGEALPQFKEIQFKITIKAGSPLTLFKFTDKIIKDDTAG